MTRQLSGGGEAVVEPPTEDRQTVRLWLHGLAIDLDRQDALAIGIALRQGGNS